MVWRMSSLNEITNWLHDHLPALLTKHKVPGAAVAVLAGGEVADLAGGVLSKATGTPQGGNVSQRIGPLPNIRAALNSL